jgi:glycosyltransferase involved in cell wall biosynthesis
MVVNSIELFARKGLMVDVFIDAETLAASPVNFTNPDIKFKVYDRNRMFRLRLARFVADKYNRWFKPSGKTAQILPVSMAVARVLPMLYFFSVWLHRELEAYNYSYVIPVENLSLLAVNGVTGSHQVVYYNMELMDWNEDNPLYSNKLFWKTLEYRAIKGVDRVTIQNRQRAEAFARINDFDLQNMCILPVASMGEPCEQRSSYFRDKFGIPGDHVIVIYAGNFAEWSCCRDIICSVHAWPDKVSLVMHTWNQWALGTDYFKGMQEDAAGLPVFFSTEYIALENMASALSSADIGLMFYQAIDDNFTEIAYSSNKLGEYLKAGLPVVCSDFPSLRDVVETWGIGAVASSPDQLGTLLPAVIAGLDGMHLNAVNCYRQHFRFELFFEEFYDNLEKGM